MKYKLWAFLGNPGREYQKTRHNLGFRVLEQLTFFPGLAWQTKFKGEWASYNQEWGKLLLLKPGVFMNLSGESVVALMDFFKVKPGDLTVIHDDLETPLGTYRFQKAGGLGGHNGLRSIKEKLGTGDFHRVRVGIGRPVHGDVSSYVLGAFSSDEEITLAQTWPGLIQELEGTLKSSH